MLISQGPVGWKIYKIKIFHLTSQWFLTLIVIPNQTLITHKHLWKTQNLYTFLYPWNNKTKNEGLLWTIHHSMHLHVLISKQNLFNSNLNCHKKLWTFLHSFYMKTMGNWHVYINLRNRNSLDWFMMINQLFYNQQYKNDWQQEWYRCFTIFNLILQRNMKCWDLLPTPFNLWD